MIAFCTDCFYCNFRKHPEGVEVTCSNELAPVSWRNKWILRRPTQDRLKCPIPEHWFLKKSSNG